MTITIDGANQPDLVTSFTGIDSHGYVSEDKPVTVHVSDGGVDVTSSQVTYQWEVLQPASHDHPSHWVTVSTNQQQLLTDRKLRGQTASRHRQLCGGRQHRHDYDVSGSDFGQ